MSLRAAWMLTTPHRTRATDPGAVSVRPSEDGLTLSKRLEALEGEKADLQRLVCELLSKNEYLRRRIREFTHRHELDI